MTDSAQSDQGRLWVVFLERQFRDEEDVRDRHKAAASAVLTSSAAFVGLLVTVAAIALGTRALPSGDNLFAQIARASLVVAVALFAGAGIFAWLVQQLQPTIAPGVAAVRAMVGSDWRSTEEQARYVIAKHFAAQIEDLRKTNAKRAEWLQWAGGFQFAAYFAITVSLISAMVGAGR